jgi:hypothetical protein
VSNIELFLNYCTRFYDRQFITRDNIHHGILERFEQLLNEYFAGEKPQLNGLPSVASCAATPPSPSAKSPTRSASSIRNISADSSNNGSATPPTNTAT